MTTDPTSLAAVLEPTAVDRNYDYGNFPGAADLVQTSQAISLKRIADALDNLAALLAAGPALAATGVPPTADLTGLMVVGGKTEPDANGFVRWSGDHEGPFERDVYVDIRTPRGDKVFGQVKDFKWAQVYEYRRAK